MSEIKAVKTRILFTKKDQEKKTESGIVLSSALGEQNPLGTVYSIGPEVTIANLVPGDKISVNWQSVGMLEHEGQKYYIVDQNNVNAVVR